MVRFMDVRARQITFEETISVQRQGKMRLYGLEKCGDKLSRRITDSSDSISSLPQIP